MVLGDQHVRVGTAGSALVCGEYRSEFGFGGVEPPWQPSMTMDRPTAAR
jgi:hypothetical protein